MYEVFYNLKAEPFRLSPDHKFCFEHKSYAKARAYMAYAFKRAEGFVMITGRPGTGKTTLIGELVESLSRDRVSTANLVCTQLDADDLLKTVAYSFGIGSAKLDKAELLQRLTILFHRWHREGRRTLLVVDEAQDLSTSAMEELRLLTNIQIGGQPLLQIFLLGQPELRDLILSAPMEQVHQRIVAATHIDGLEADETEAYVIHRLQAVGWHGDPAIDRAIFPLIHKFSEGVPRRINLICSRLFLLGSVEQRHAIEVDDVRVVISELQAESLAAGTGFSQDDFFVSGKPEWVPVPVATLQMPSEPHLRAVNGELYIAAEGDLAEGADGAKKKDIPGIAPVSHPVPASDSIGPYVASSRVEVEPGDGKGGESFYENAAAVSDSRWREPDRGEKTFAPRPGRAVEPHTSWRRGISLVFVVIVAVALTLSISAYFSHQENWSNPESESDPLTYVGSSQSTASVNAPPASDYPSSDQFSEALDPPSSLPATDFHDNASDRVPEVAESIAPLSPQGATTDDTFLSQSSQDTELSKSNELASSGISAGEKSGSLPSAISVPEDFEQTFLVSFAFDSDDLLPDSHQALDSALKSLRDQPNSLASIMGYTDRRGDEQYNLTLSRKRADAVELYLVEGGIARKRLHVEGRGVLTTPVEDQLPGAAVDMEPHRIVQIKLSTDPSQ